MDESVYNIRTYLSNYLSQRHICANHCTQWCAIERGQVAGWGVGGWEVANLVLAPENHINQRLAGRLASSIFWRVNPYGFCLTERFKL